MYTLRISEDQRQALLKTLQFAGPALQRQGEPLEYWLDMLTELPKVEEESPGIIHGFCL